MNTRPPPPPTLSKEYLRVWVGWYMIGDREVAREAAAKGIYIELALQFIASRKEWDHSDVERWFKSEILTWVYHLLEQKQIFKACHILSNIGIDSTEQLSSILSDTTSKIVRDYIADHLLKSGKLETSLLNSWRFLTAIETYNSFTFNKLWDDISKISISKIDNKSAEWKSHIATVLFFNTFDLTLDSFISPEYAWDNLLANEKLDILKVWVNVYFSKDLNYQCKINVNPDIYQKLKNIFLLWEINIGMINQLNSKTSTYSEFAKDFVLNDLSYFGIFSEEEKLDVSKIVSRFSRTQNVQNISSILRESTANLNIEVFYEKLTEFCVQNKLYEVLSVCCSEYSFYSNILRDNNSKELALWLQSKDFSNGVVSDETICKNIIIFINYFSDNNNVNIYIQNNPILLLAIILFTKDISLYAVISNNLSKNINNITLNCNEITNILKSLPVLNNIIEKFISTSNNCLNFYDLLEKYSQINSAFDFRKSADSDVPNFRSAKISKKYGFSENINYLYYVKQTRPSKATKLFLLDEDKSDLNVLEAERKTLKVLYKNCTNFEIASSCIAFLGMVGLPTEKVRIIVSVIEIFIGAIDLYTVQEVQELFSDLDKNSSTILQSLENIILNQCDFSSPTADKFISIIKDYELAVQFAKSQHQDLPCKYLKHCAENHLWLPFIIFIQIFDYPLEQSLNLTMYFKNKEIMDHLNHALSNEVEVEAGANYKNILSNSMMSSTTSFDAGEALGGGGNEFDFAPRSDFLKILIRSHKSEDPPSALLQASQMYKNPILAILATCYEPDSVIINWITWLSISSNIEIDVIENYSVSPTLVSSLLNNVLRKKYTRTLAESFEIFLPDNPLHHLAQFLHACTQLNFESSNRFLALFEKSVVHLNYNSALLTYDFEYTFLTNRFWSIDTSLKLIFTVLGHCFQSKLHQITFLNILCQSKFTENVPIECPDFCAIRQLLENLSADVTLNLSLFLNTDSRRFEITKCIEKLVKIKQFKNALHLAKYENICKEYVLNEEWSLQLKETGNYDFWDACETAFVNAEILPSSAALFYIFCCTNLQDNCDKYKAIKLAYTWLKQSDYSDQFVENIEQEIWSNYFALDDGTLTGSYFSKHETNYLLTEILENSKTVTKFENSLNLEQLRHLEETIGKILESGDIIEAIRLDKMFDFKSAEIEILLTCYELAEGKRKPYEISAQQRLLFLNRNMNLKCGPHRRRTIKSARHSSISSVSYDSTTATSVPETNYEIASLDTLALLETMTDRLKHCNNIASRILMCYRISINVNKPYQEIVKYTDSVELLKTALENDCKNKLEVVHDVFVIFKWSNLEITEFIFHELKAAIYLSMEMNLDGVVMWDLHLDSQFHLVLQLCSENNSLLGKKLLVLTHDLQETQLLFNSKTVPIDEQQINIMITVELLVRAHDCFNAYCNMEGIASILRKAQMLTSILINLRNWKLMVRLLTGIGKYTEMNYIFQILKENDQFEYLLKQSFRKDERLKVALLKFLKKHCPKNQELYRIVALHFKLFSEVAELWENEGLEMINNLLEIAKLETQNQGVKNFQVDIILLMNNDSTKLSLNKAMVNYTHAAEYHLHGDTLNSAMRSARKAELLALQISILKSLPNNATTKCIVQQNPQQILELICFDLNFQQTKILIESYNYQADWGLILFKQCILHGRLEFLEDFVASKPLTNTLAQDLTRRFLSEKLLTQNYIKAMKEVLRKVESVHMKYRLASELGFTDVIETLLSGTQLAFLKDTVWKKGYKQM